MAWLPDEQYILMQDTKEKSITARSARHTRTHCGKSGAVKFPSDYLTEKERKNMSGECKSYRMNDPMTWEDFKKLPDDLKVCYIKALRQKYNVTDKALCEMFGTPKSCLSKLLTELGLNKGAGYGKRNWKKDEFMAWRTGDKVVEVTGYPTTKKEIEAIEKEHTPPTKKDLKKFMDEADATEPAKFPHGGAFEIPPLTVSRHAVPRAGRMTFVDNADDILKTIKDILKNERVRFTVDWHVVDETGVVNVDAENLAKAATTINYALLNEQRKKALGTKG